MGAGLRPKAKAVDEPPDPKVRAPVLDPTGGGRRKRSLMATAPTAYPTKGAGKKIERPVRLPVSGMVHYVLKPPGPVRAGGGLSGRFFSSDEILPTRR
jgi:hypothetical protein